jgi:hypothetical protein
MKFVFADGGKIGYFDGNGHTVYESKYITGYKNNALRTAKNKEWKKQTDRMMQDEYYFQSLDETEVIASVCSVALTPQENTLLYAFTVNGTSGIYAKSLDDKEKTESHVITSNEEDFHSLHTTQDGQTLGAVRTDSVVSNIAVFKQNGGDYKSLTGGDSFDENPAFDPQGNVLFNSYAVGRDANNNFVAYMPSEIYRLNVTTLDTEILLSDEKYSFVKPIMDSQGNLYCIKKPDSEKSEGNIFLDILLIPVRIVEAIVGFISAFVMCFSGKPMISGQSAKSIGNGGDAAKNGKGDPKKAFINNNLVNVEKELKKNKKSDEYGFIPRSWTLIKVTKNGEMKELAHGVADFALVEEGQENTLVYTTGKRIFSVIDGENGVKKEKLFNVDFCVKVGGIQTGKQEKCDGQVCDDGLFDKL